MAVFPDRIVLKNSTDSQAAIEAAIQVGGTDEISQGEIVLGLQPSTVTIFTKTSDGSIISFDPTSAAGRAIVSDIAPTVGINGLPLADGDLWFKSNSDSYHVYYLSAWVQVSGGSGGAVVLGDLTDVDLSTPPTNGQVISYNSTSGNWEPVDQGAGLLSVVEDTTPQLGGNLDINGYDIVSTTNVDIQIEPGAGGRLVSRGNGLDDGGIALACASNLHAVVIQSPPHSDAASYTLVLPSSVGSAGQVLTSQGGAQLTWEDPGGSSIDDLTDVDTSTTPPTANQVLTWVASNNQWEPAEPTAGTGAVDSVNGETGVVVFDRIVGGTFGSGI